MPDALLTIKPLILQSMGAENEHSAAVKQGVIDVLDSLISDHAEAGFEQSDDTDDALKRLDAALVNLAIEAEEEDIDYGEDEDEDDDPLKDFGAEDEDEDTD